MEAVGDSARYLAEWYIPELTEESVDDLVTRLDAATAALASEGAPIRLLLTLSVPTDEVLYGVFAAPSRETVSQACERAGLPYQRLSDHIDARFRPRLCNVAK